MPAPHPGDFSLRQLMKMNQLQQQNGFGISLGERVANRASKQFQERLFVRKPSPAAVFDRKNRRTTVLKLGSRRGRFVCVSGPPGDWSQRSEARIRARIAPDTCRGGSADWEARQSNRTKDRPPGPRLRWHSRLAHKEPPPAGRDIGCATPPPLRYSRSGRSAQSSGLAREWMWPMRHSDTGG